MADDIKQAITDKLKANIKKKKLYYSKDVTKMLPDYPPRDVKKAIKEMLNEGKLKYWSSGSTTYVTLPEVDHIGEGED